MSISQTDHQTEDWMNLNLDNDLQPESDKIFDSEKCDLVLESARPDFLAQAEKGDGLDLLLDCRKEEFTPEPDKGDYKHESEKGDFRTESEESDLDSDKSQTGLEFIDRVSDAQMTGLLDGATESDFLIRDGSPKENGATRRFRGTRDSGSTESTTNQFQSEPEQTQDGTAFTQNGEQICKSSPFSGAEFAPADVSLGGWVWYLVPKTICLLVLSLIYLGFSMLGIRMWSSSTDNI